MAKLFFSSRAKKVRADFHTKMSDFFSLECKEKFKPRRDINWGDHFQFNLTVEKVDKTKGLFNTTSIRFIHFLVYTRLFILSSFFKTRIQSKREIKSELIQSILIKYNWCP